MKLLKLRIASIMLLALLLNSTAYAQMSSKQVDSLVNYAMGKFNMAGLSVAIVKDGKIIHNKGSRCTSD